MSFKKSRREGRGENLVFVARTTTSAEWEERGRDQCQIGSLSFRGLRDG